MNSNFDPRAWNLFAGVALVSAGCGPRLASQEAGDSGETADTTPEGPEGPEPECIDGTDCPVGYGCYDGVCTYYPHHDGWIPYYDCYSDSECDEFELCQYGYCELLGLPPPNCEELGLAWPAPTSIYAEGGELALTFADVDADGQDELVVATPNELRVYESGGGAPTSSPRVEQLVTDMVAGDFDALPGEDVLLLVGDSLALHGSNGDGSFAAPTVNPILLGFVSELFAGDLDGQPPTDLLAWGGAGAYIDLSGQLEIFETSQIMGAAVHELGTPEPAFALRRQTAIDVYSLDAQLLTTWSDIEGAASVTAFNREFASEYVTLTFYSTWSRVHSRGVNGGSDEWSMVGTASRAVAGDLDGSETDELVYLDGDKTWVQFNPLEDGDCWHDLPVPGIAVEAVFGDHDGDGDQELAVSTHDGQVVLFDGG